MHESVIDYYTGQDVVVTGGAGFIGHKLVKFLLSAGANVTVIDNMSRGTTMIEDAKYYKESVTNKFVCEEHFSEADIVFNLAAAVAGVLHNQSHHLEMYQRNIGMLLAPVAAAKRVGLHSFLQVSSVCVYAPEYNAPSSEEYGLVGIPHPANAGYAEAKRDGERAVLWADLKRAVIVRPSNVIGVLDYFDDLAHVVPALIKRAVETEDGGEFVLYGPATTLREFIDSEDVALGMMYAMARGVHTEAYNLGTSGINTITMNSLAHQILHLVGRKNVRVIAKTEFGGGDSRRFSDSSKIHGLGWHHAISLDESLQRIVEWYIEREARTD